MSRFRTSGTEMEAAKPPQGLPVWISMWLRGVRSFSVHRLTVRAASNGAVAGS